MILKKPYAFLIKYFRVIHFLLLFFLVWYAYKSRSILEFFNGYVKSNYQTSVVTGLPKLYAPVSLIIIVLFIIITLGAFMVLMVHKKKPYKLYLFTTLYYIFVFFSLFYVRSILASFEETMLAATTARSLRDVLVLTSLPQYAFILSIFLRAIGFDLKKFDFASDLRQMNYSSKDAEEFEVNVNLDVYKARRKVRRLFRELVYYVKENKFVVITVCIVAALVLFNYIRTNIHGNYDKTYHMNKTFKYEKIDVTFQDAIISNLDYNGKKIDDEKYYLAIKISVGNESGSSFRVDYNNFKLRIGDRLINPTITDSKYFIDMASSIVPTVINHRSNHTFVLVYELNANEINRVNEIVINNGAIYKNGKYIDKHIYVKLKSKKIKSVDKVNDYTLKEEISFEKSMINNTTLNIESHSLYKRYIYKYNDCISKDNCGLFDDMLTLKSGVIDKVILVFEGQYSQDMNTGYALSYTSLSSFAGNFCTVQYRISGQLYNDAVNITPINAINFMAFEVSQNIEQADLIQLIITIRDKKYFLNINP